MFKFKGISSDAMKCIVEEEINLLKRASKLVESNRESANYSLEYTEYGYGIVSGNINVQILDLTKRDEILSWLLGKSILEYNNRISYCAFFEEVDLQRSSCINKASFSFIRSPFWYKKDDQYVTVTNNIINEGNVEVEPIIRIEKRTTSKVDLTINNVRFVYNFPSNENYVEIDCQDGNAKYNGLFRNENFEITYEYPKLSPGNNSVIINEGNCTLKIKRKDCWL